MKKSERLWFSTGDVAHMLGTTSKTVSKWIDTGALKGRRFKGMKHRRVMRGDVVQFLKDNKLPLRLLERCDKNGKEK